jgi:uncharacterized membrane protein
VSYPLFAQLQIVVAIVALALAIRAHGVVPRAALAAFAAVFVISFGCEFGGTSYGIPFGKYEYTSLLGPKILGKVPFLIPVSWFCMAVPAFGLADRLVGARPGAWLRVVYGSLFLLIWDLTLDPAMSYILPFWLWENPGSYYGMPWINLFGWFVTGVAIMCAFAGLGSRAWIAKLPAGYLWAYYLLTLSLPVGMLLAARIVLPLLYTGLAVGAIYAIHAAVARRGEVAGKGAAPAPAGT